MSYAKAMFLINNHETEPLEIDTLLQQFVRAYDDIHGSIGQAFEDRGAVLLRAKA